MPEPTEGAETLAEPILVATQAETRNVEPDGAVVPALFTAHEFPAASDEGNILTMALMTALGQGKCALLDAFAMEEW